MGPACEICGHPVPREDDNWRYDTCSNECLRLSVSIERHNSRRFRLLKKQPVQLSLGLRVRGEVVTITGERRRKVRAA
jgi:predicted nucleic acid-binding Zn ribbon protein